MKIILVVGGTGRHMHRWLYYVSSVLSADIELDFFCTSKGGSNFIGVNNVYKADNSTLSYIVKGIPKIRGYVNIYENKKGLLKVIKGKPYTAMIVHQPEVWELSSVRFAKQHNIKVILTPWGSDVLRIPHSYDKEMSEIFNIADHFTTNLPYFAEQYTTRYNVNRTKMVYAGFGSEVFDYIELYKGKFSKSELAKALSIPQSDYYIACGYTAQRAQNHLLMVEALGQNKDLLPLNAILMFQFTYGNNKDYDYIREIKNRCAKYGLTCIFLTNYLSNEDMAKYRLLADLFIHIQPTDAANASLAEFLLAGCDCINGGWLSYPQLEKYGNPYYICPKLEDLSKVIKNVFLKKEKRIYLPEEIKDAILQGSWKIQKKYWAAILNSL